MVGGNSSVHGYDHLGNEMFWTAIGDIVTSLTLMDYNKDSSNELVVSSEDFNIRIFDRNQMIAELVETEVVTNLVALPENRLAYSVSNGTIGVYEQDVRLWRVKSKHFAISIHFYDLLGQSFPQLITGWSNGKMDCRSIKTGEVFFKDTLNSGVSGIVEGDYRSIGKTDLICVSSGGEVRGYTTTKTLTNGSGFGKGEETYSELLTQKQALLMELKHYETNARINENIGNLEDSYENSGIIPADTRLQMVISTNDKAKKPHVELFLSTNNSTILKSIIIFGEGIFKGETHVTHPPISKLRSDLTVPLFLPKDNPVDIHVKALVGFPHSVQFHVYEITRQLPRFSMYSLKNPNDIIKPESFVQFKLNERVQRICMWINQNFLFSSDIEFESGPNLTLNVKCLRDNSDLVIVSEISGRITIHTMNMSLAGDLIQSLCSYLNVNTLESKASFPEEENNLKLLLEKLIEIQDASARLNTDVADRLTQIRTLIIQAEDSRLNDLDQLPFYYNELMAINKEMIGGHNIRLQNYNEVVETTKGINAIIQKASKLRVGQKSSNVINYCRNYMNNNNAEGLIKVIRTGEQ
nr:Bardet-Biedl syndrome 2 protein homolog [Leptinotarsa decemlineata]